MTRMRHNFSAMKAGFATADITPALGMEAPGGYLKAYVQRIHDPLKVRAAVLDDGQFTLAFVGVDTCMLTDREMLARARAEVEGRCGIPGEHLLITASHTHSGGPVAGITTGDAGDAPPLVRELLERHSIAADPLYAGWVERGIVTAVCEAHRRREEALLSVGSGHEDQVAFNRRFRMANGRVYTHPGKGNPEIAAPAGPIDPEVGVLAAWATGQEEAPGLLGCIVHYACHATTFSGGVSADFVAYLERTVQGAMGGDPVILFLPGAAGDVTQVDNRSLREREFGARWSRFVGTRIGAEAVKVLVTATPGELSPLAAATETLRLARRAPSAARREASREIVAAGLASGDRGTAWTFAKEILILEHLIAREPEVAVPLQALQVGPAVFLANPAEFFCESGLAIKASSPFPLTYVTTLANGCVGYVPPAHAFGPDGGGYETVLTSYSNLELDAERRIVEGSIALTRRLTPGTLPQPAQVEAPGRPWAYGVLGPDVE
jgi:neutral ceramidase